MKVIFLDFDGVVNCFNEPESLRTLSMKCVKNLNTLLKKSEANIVISSVWRISQSLDNLRQILIDAGFVYPERVIGITPKKYGHRGSEINAYLKDHQSVESFIILDDDSDMEPYMDRLVKINSGRGLTKKDVATALIKLGSN